MIPCEKAAIICSKAQYSEASLLDKLRLRLHILYCKTCHSYTKKNKRLTSLCQKAPLHSLSEQDKAEIKRHLTDIH